MNNQQDNQVPVTNPVSPQVPSGQNDGTVGSALTPQPVPGGSALPPQPGPSGSALPPQPNPANPRVQPVQSGSIPSTTTPSNTQPVPANPDPSAHLTQKMNPDDLASMWRRTKCLNCGYTHEGAKVLKKCPKCGNTDPDKFQEAD